MKQQHRTVNILLVVFSCLPLAYLALIWNRLPAIVPIHFNARLEPDRLASKNELWVPVLILTGVSVLVLFLLQNLRILDPKRRNEPASPVFNKMAAGILIFLTIINFMIITASYKGERVLNDFLFSLLGLLFAFIGNYMHNIKPNYFAGIRLPWTLSDDENWKMTHRLAGKIWFWGGMLLAVAGLFLPAKVLFPVFIGMVVVLTLIPAIYSYWLFKNKA